MVWNWASENTVDIIHPGLELFTRSLNLVKHLETIQHIEDLENEDHDGKLMLTTVLANKVHHVLEIGQEHVSKNVNMLLLVFIIITRKCADKFFKSSEAHNLYLRVVTFQSVLDLFDAILPLSFQEICLSDIENDVLNLVPISQ